jgi:hypothetical protein
MAVVVLQSSGRFLCNQRRLWAKVWRISKIIGLISKKEAPKTVVSVPYLLGC